MKLYINYLKENNKKYNSERFEVKNKDNLKK